MGVEEGNAVTSASVAQPRRVFLHIGVPKTGTTYLQDRLWRNRDAALRQGFLYPGDIREAHFHAAVQLQPDRYPHWVDPRHGHAWDRLVAQVREWPGSSVISHELLATATAEQAAKALRALSFAEVHIVCTARDLARQIPSVWQENLKNRHTATFGEFVAAIRRREESEEAPFWEYQDLPRILATWGAGLPPERVHVVTSPSPVDSPQVIWQRFTTALGIDPAGLTRDLPTANNSLDAPQLELLRRLNGRLHDIDWERYESVVKEYLVGNLMIVSSWRGTQKLPESDVEWVSDIAAEFVGEIEAAGYHVVGDLGDLQPRSASTAVSAEPGDRDLLDVAVDTLVDVMRTMPKPASDRTAGQRIRNMVRGQHLRLRAQWSGQSRRQNI
ncbi:MAG: sulfotransferase family protein [Actinomycetota bacterium]|nr:sulfotransferase family protein [Actinomycetota bacterium]